ncbi:MAG: hypothetical protein U0521_00495 [Anaerolineae bacterium]
MTADDMNALMPDLFAEGYGDAMQYDRDRSGITWATFGHLYANTRVPVRDRDFGGARAAQPRSGGRAGRGGELRQVPQRAGASLYPLDGA